MDTYRRCGHGHGSTFGDANVYNTTATADAYGTYILQWEIVNGTCTTNDPVTINYAEAAAAGPDQDLCGVLVANLAGNQETIGVGTWTRIGGAGTGTITFGDANVYNTTATADAYGTYILQWEIVNGTCTTNDPVTINYAEAAAAGPDEDLCGVLVANLAGNAGDDRYRHVEAYGGAGRARSSLGIRMYTIRRPPLMFMAHMSWELLMVRVRPMMMLRSTMQRQQARVLTRISAAYWWLPWLEMRRRSVSASGHVSAVRAGHDHLWRCECVQHGRNRRCLWRLCLRWTIVNGACTTHDHVTINYAEAAAVHEQDICGVLVANLAGNAATIGVGTWTRSAVRAGHDHLWRYECVQHDRHR